MNNRSAINQTIQCSIADLEQLHKSLHLQNHMVAHAHPHIAMDQRGYLGDLASTQGYHKRAPTVDLSSVHLVPRNILHSFLAMALPCHKGNLGAQELARTQILTKILPIQA
jgi:hypothetical protein